MVLLCFFKQKTAYEMRISDWSSDVCSSDLVMDAVGLAATRAAASRWVAPGGVILHIGLGDNEGGLDVRRATLQEITFIGTYTYTTTDFADALAALAAGQLGALGWVEPRPLAEGLAAFRDRKSTRLNSSH